jgi:hypothetical protein
MLTEVSVQRVLERMSQFAADQHAEGGEPISRGHHIQWLSGASGWQRVRNVSKKSSA